MSAEWRERLIAILNSSWILSLIVRVGDNCVVRPCTCTTTVALKQNSSILWGVFFCPKFWVIWCDLVQRLQGIHSWYFACIMLAYCKWRGSSNHYSCAFFFFFWGLRVFCWEEEACSFSVYSVVLVGCYIMGCTPDGYTVCDVRDLSFRMGVGYVCEEEIFHCFIFCFHQTQLTDWASPFISSVLWWRSSLSLFALSVFAVSVALS